MLSIIIPTLNEEKYLPRLLNNLQSQAIGEHEIIVSDGGSKDNTVQIAKQSGCKVIKNAKGKKGPAHQRNAGAEIAKGEFLLFLDADTILPKNFFRSVLKEFEKRKLDIAGFYFEFDKNDFKYKFAEKCARLSFLLFHKIRPLSIGAAILSKKNYHQKVRGFSTKIKVGEDHHYAAKIKKAGGRYGLIKSKKVIFCTRRMEQEGFWKVFAKWKIIRFALFGPLKYNKVKYEFGKYE